MKRIDSSEALKLISLGKPIDRYEIDMLDLTKIGTEINVAITVKNSIINHFYSPSIKFQQKMIIEDCQLSRCTFNYVYFVRGITIQNTVVQSYLDLEAGGHNEEPFILRHNTFMGFVNFFDCWFKNDLIVENNIFRKGSNLLGNKEEPYGVRFEKKPMIRGNQGDIDLNGEGERSDNVILV